MEYKNFIDLKDIIKIMVKGSSGYGSIDTAFNDRLTIEPKKISYLLKQGTLFEQDKVIKWSYQRNENEYEKLFQELSLELKNIFDSEYEYFYFDIGTLEISIIFEDKTKWKKDFFVPVYHFEALYRILKQMIPAKEELPKFLLSGEDYGEPIYPMWNTEKDYLITNKKPLLKENETLESSQFFRWAFSLNTAVGLYRRSEIKKVQQNKSHLLSNGEKMTFRYKEELPNCLMLDNGKEYKCIMEDIVIWPTNYCEEFMIFSSNQTKKTYLIDSRGSIYQLPGVAACDKYGNGGSVEKDRRNGCYYINGFIVSYQSPEQQKVFKEKSQANAGAILNKEFNRFMRSNAHNEIGYLYLTAGNTKCGAMVSHFADRGMYYEVIPNIFCDDDTVNIRIPLNGKNASREDVQYLYAKYENNYSIYNIPYTQIGGGLVFPEKWKQKYYDQGYYLPKGKEAMIYSVVDTLRLVFKTEDDYEVFKKSLSKIARLFERGSDPMDDNLFTSILLLYPKEYGVNDTYVSQRREYINTLLKLAGLDDRIEEIKTVLPKGEDEEIFWIEEEHFSHKLYSLAYQESKKQYKEKMQTYESSVLSAISSEGKRISKWVNESNLFTSVVKEYPDAIYQYRAEWLGLQSLDIYIPSLHIGIEYQGEQHYRPVKLFGGEEGYKNTVARDKKKARLCEENGVYLLYWRYDEVISKTKIVKKIQGIIEK